MHLNLSKCRTNAANAAAVSLTIILLITLFLAACQGSYSTGSNANAAAAANNTGNVSPLPKSPENNRASNGNNNDSPAANTNSSADKPSLDDGNADSPLVAAKINDKAIETNNLEMYKSNLSKNKLRELEEGAKKENKTLDEWLIWYFKTINDGWKGAPKKQDEWRNLTIKGDKATAELKINPTMWYVIEFTKENGKWKYDGGVMAVENYKKKHPDYKTIN